MHRVRLFVAAAAVLAVMVIPAVSGAAPTCTDPVPQAACGNRVVADPLLSTTFIQHKTEYKPVLDAIEKLAPGIIDVKPLGEMIGDPTLRSAGNRQIYVIKVTDESVTAPKRQVAVSLSVHANETAGREGGIRYIEDLARWWSSNKTRALYAGDVAKPLNEVLAQTEIYFSVLNPDGWEKGDLGGTQPQRGNEKGVDLNRQFPTLGWTKANQAVEPEARGWVELVGNLPNLTTAADIHGELTSNNNAFSDIMYPAGEWSPREQAQELQFAQHMNDTVARKFKDEGVVLQTLFDQAGDRRPMKPANFATAFDVVGYDDSGFMGDWFVREGAVELDVENFLSHTVPGNVWVPALEQAHVAAVKGNIEATIVESMITHEVKPDLNLGRVAYVFDPQRVERVAGENGAGYSVSRMDYFEDMAADAGVPVDRIDAADVATADLSTYDSVVLADLTVPADAQGREVNEAAYTAALDRFAKAGGQLVLTDRAVELMPSLAADKVTAADVKMSLYQGGTVDFGALDHAWEKGLAGTPRQTYYAVPLGYRSSSTIRDSRNYGLTSAAMQRLGGTTVGTIDSAATVNLGSIRHGAGSIAIFGSILPTQTQKNRHDYGLVDYAVTVTGGEVLHSILEYRRPTETTTP